MKPQVPLVGFFALLLLLALAPSAAAASRVVCELEPGVLDEISGMAMSRQHPGIVWATNDSGNDPSLYAVDLEDCRVRATLHMLDTPGRDHEALAIGMDERRRHVIWVGDIGDNQDSWPYARIHKVTEPRRLGDADVPVTTYRFTYPQGPTNAEALVADPRSPRLWVITKESGVGGIFALPTPMSDSQTPMQTTQVGQARSLITDAAMAPAGDRFAVRDYLSAEVFQGDPPGAALARFGLPLQAQGEAVTWTADGRHLLIASERELALREVDVPESALEEQGGIAAALPHVAGFDIYPVVRWLLIGAVALTVIVLLRRRRRRR